MPSLKELGLNKAIDCHTHSGGVDHYNLFSGNLPISQSVDDLMLKSKASEIDKVITFPFPSTNYYDTRKLVESNERVNSGLQKFPYQIENMALIRGCEESSEKLLPFMCIDPSSHTKEQIDYLEKIYKRKKFFGLKLHTLAVRVKATRLERSDFIDFALNKNIPIIIHSALQDEFSHPENIVKLAKIYPQLRVCIAHLACLDEEVIKNVPKFANLYLDTSPFLQICNKVREGSKIVYSPNNINPNKPTESLLFYYKKLKDNLIWGTDEPWTKCISSSGKVSSNHTYADEVDILIKLSELSSEAVFNITTRNSERFLFG